MMTKFAKFSWTVLAFNIVVILWGAYVRASGSGAGCGSHWPLCNGEVIPRSPAAETIVEFIHRATSGMAFLLVVALFYWAVRTTQKGSLLRRSAGFSLFFMITEALIGAGLVLFAWVAKDASTGRATAIVVHLVNTFFLLASIAATAWIASKPQTGIKYQYSYLYPILFLGLLGMVVLGASGALTALGDTLFPSQSLLEGIQQDLSETAHFLIRLRVLHPTLAVLVGAYLLFVAGISRLNNQDPWARKVARFLTLGVLLQLAAGVINLLLLAPIWMQIVHLLLADLVWIALVLLTLTHMSLRYNS
jgi:heme A synthase